MIAFLKGVVAGKTPSSVYLEVSGVGYEVFMGQSSLSRLPEVGQPASVFTYLQVREDALALFGFLSVEEKSLFEKLISISGVGPKMALAALSVYSPTQLVNAIAAQDAAAVQRIPGVGKKTAQRIILELKGSLHQDTSALFTQEGEVSVMGSDVVALKSAQEVLLSMGFTSTESDLALKGAPSGADESALIKYALKRLGS